MDRSSGKRRAGGSVTPRKTYNATAFKEAATEGDHSAQFCNRIGCSGRVKFCQNARNGISDTSKYSRPSFRSSNGNEVTGKFSRSNSAVTSTSSSNGNEVTGKFSRSNSAVTSTSSSNGNEVTGKFSRSNSAMTTTKKSCLDSKRKMSSEVTSDPSESSPSTQFEAQGVVSRPSNLSGYQPETIKSKEVNMTEAGSSSTSSSVGPRKTLRSKSGLSNQSTSTASPVPSASRNSALGPFNRINGSRYGMQNFKCNSMPDAMPPSCSQLESESARKNFIKKRSVGRESSSSYRGRKNTASPNEDRHTSSTTSGNSASVEDGSGSSSTWNQRAMNINNTKTRFSSRQDGRNSSSVREPAVSFSRNDYETPFDDGDESNLQQLSASGARSRRLSRINSDNSSSRTSFASAESGLAHLINNDVVRRFNMDEIAEVLMALERIEQDEELTHEQILALETRLFLSGLNLYDQHRDMRLDIDNMSYEELLALEERMGTVSTALPEEALSKCLMRSIYEAAPSEVEVTESGEDGDDTKCSICQEEFVTGDEIGNLVECQHGYHAMCINEWLQLKKWCPICKTEVAPSHSSSSL